MSVFFCLGLAECGDNTVVPTVSVTPVEGFIPKCGSRPKISYVPPVSRLNQLYASYAHGTNLVRVAGDFIQVRLVARNESDVPLARLMFAFYVEDPRKSFLFKVDEWAIIGSDNFNKPTPAMLDEETPLFDEDPYDGFVTYIPSRPLQPREEYEFEVWALGSVGLTMHVEGFAWTGDADGEPWALPKPFSGTTIEIVNCPFGHDCGAQTFGCERERATLGIQAQKTEPVDAANASESLFRRQ